jgi:hypothetical protein
MTIKKIEMFATHNDTDQYAICADGYFGLFDTRELAEQCYALVDEICESGCGSMQMLPPGYEPRNRLALGKPVMTQSRLSESRAIDIAHYIKQ